MYYVIELLLKDLLISYFEGAWGAGWVSERVISNTSKEGLDFFFVRQCDVNTWIDHFQIREILTTYQQKYRNLSLDPPSA